jgi:acetylornithine deacetylase/succinyl-diaminopimelate desuccinylase-like protein
MDVKALETEAVDLLRGLLRIDTSNPPGHETAAAEYLARYLRENGVECELVARDPERANLVARIRGTRAGAPSLTLLGHTDVVPAEPAMWTHPPFDAVLDDDGWIWGRGALDMKNEVATRAVTMAAIARSGEPLAGDLQLLIVSDEEDGTSNVGMRWLVGERPDLATDYLINEGETMHLELTDGRRFVTIGVGEKATALVRVTALGTPGHASMPYEYDHAVPALAELITRLAAYRPKRKLLPATRTMIEQLVGYPIGDDIDGALERAAELEPNFARTIRSAFSTTIAPTRLYGSPALNVLPGRASVDCDCRLLPGTTVDELYAELREALGEGVAYELELIDPLIGGTISDVDSPLFQACSDFVTREDPEAALLPMLGVGFTDTHYAREAYGCIGYGFWPAKYTPDETWNTIHGHDERVHSGDLGFSTAFSIELCRTLLGA